MIALGWIYWAAYQLLSLLVLTPLGMLVLGVMAPLRLWTRRESYMPAFPGEVWAWRGGWLTAVWGNEEDGIGGRHRIDPSPRAAWLWCAWRNSTSGMRLLPGAYFELPHPPHVRTTSDGYVATIGWRQCRAFRFRGTPYRIGWMIDDDAQAGWRSWPIVAKRKPGT